MGLPKIKMPRFETTLPISKRKVKYRGFTVGEEKSLLVAKEAQDESQIAIAIGDIVREVSFGAIDPDKTPFVDVVFLYVMAAARSIGNKQQISFSCDCPEEGEVLASADLGDVKTIVEEVDPVIRFEDTEDGSGEIVITLKPISFTVFTSNDVNDDAQLFKSIVQSIVVGDEAVDIESVEDSEWEEFFLSLPKDAYGKITKFLANPPRATITAKGKCQKCGKEVTREIEGMRNFF